jgi:hypothetical protein
LDSVVPPGFEYSWYNIRTCVSDEGQFYTHSTLATKRVDGRLVLGSLDILLEKSDTMFGPSTYHAVVVYFMKVVLANDFSYKARKFLLG